jgi:alkyl hydroperoxide reductase subunit AhpF
MRGIMNLTTQVNALAQQQDQISQDLAHNTELTLQNWGMTSAMHYDLSGVFTHVGLSPNQQQHYYPDQHHYYPDQQQHDPN